MLVKRLLLIPIACLALGAQSAFACNSSFAHLANSIPRSNSSMVEQARSAAINENMSQMIANARAQAGTLQAAAALAIEQAQLFEQYKRDAEATMRSSAAAGAYESYINNLRNGNWSVVTDSQGIFQSAVQAWAIYQIGYVANIESAVQLMCRAVG